LRIKSICPSLHFGSIVSILVYKTVEEKEEPHLSSSASAASSSAVAAKSYV